MQLCYLIEAPAFEYGLGSCLYASLQVDDGGWFGTTNPNMASRFLHRHQAEEMLRNLKLPPMWKVEEHDFETGLCLILIMKRD